MKKKTDKNFLKKIWSFKAAILSFGIAFAVIFFFGVFWTRVKYENYDKTHHFYMNRGSFGTWVGEGSKNGEVDLPYVKAPFVMAHDPFSGGEISKIIDLSIFIPLFLSIWFLFYPLVFPLAKATEDSEKFDKFYYPFLVLVLLVDKFFYFVWFPTV